MSNDTRFWDQSQQPVVPESPAEPPWEPASVPEAAGPALGAPQPHANEPRRSTARRSKLSATRAQRAKFYATARPVKIVAGIAVAATIATGAYDNRAPLSEAWARAVHPAVQPSAGPTVATSAPNVDQASLVALVKARTTLGLDADNASELWASSQGKVDEQLRTDLAYWRNRATTAATFADTLDEVEQASNGLSNSVAAVKTAVKDWEAADQQRQADEAAAAAAADQAARDAAAHNSQTGGNPGGGSTPQQPGNTGSSGQTARFTQNVTCNEATTIVFTATGGGTVTITAGGKTSTGAGSATLSIAGQSVSATATGTGNIAMSYTWEGIGTLTCTS